MAPELALRDDATLSQVISSSMTSGGARGSRDFSLRRILINATSVGIGSLAALGGRFLALLLAAHYLDPAAFGVLAVLQSAVSVCERLLNGQSWQFVVRDGAAYHESAGLPLLAVLVAAAGADLLSATGSFVLALSAVGLGGEALGLRGVHIGDVWPYCAIVVFNQHGVCAGLLRVRDAFRAYALYQLIIGVLLPIATLVSALLHPPTYRSILLTWLAVEATAFAALLAMAISQFPIHTLPRRGIGRLMHEVRLAFVRGRSLLLSGSLIGSLRMIVKEGDVLFVAGLAGAGAAGIYKIARNLASLPLLATDAIYYATFPAFAKMFSAGAHKAVRSRIRSMMLVGFSIGVASVILVEALGPRMLAMIGGAAAESGTVLRVYILATFVAAATFPFAPAIISSGHHRHQVVSLIVASLGYLLSVWFFVGWFGAAGAAVAVLCYYGLWATFTGWKLKAEGLL